MIVRRVRDANPAHVVANEQGELFPAWRHHAVFTDSPLTLVQAEADHRRHAIIEQVIADLKNGPLAHLPSGRFTANCAWLVLAAMAFNLTRAAGALAGAVPRQSDHRDDPPQLINVAARPVRSARRVHLRLPTNWPWADRLARPVHRRPRPTQLQSLPDHPATRPRPELTWKAGQTGGSSTPTPIQPEHKIHNGQPKSDRCIRAQAQEFRFQQAQGACDLLEPVDARYGGRGAAEGTQALVMRHFGSKQGNASSSRTDPSRATTPRAADVRATPPGTSTPAWPGRDRASSLR